MCSTPRLLRRMSRSGFIPERWPTLSFAAADPPQWKDARDECSGARAWRSPAKDLNPELLAGCWLTCDTVEGWGGSALFMNTEEGSWGGSGMAGLEDLVEVDGLAGVVESILDAIQDDVAH